MIFQVRKSYQWPKASLTTEICWVLEWSIGLRENRERNFRWEEKGMKEVSKTPVLQVWERYLIVGEGTNLEKKMSWFGTSWVSSDGKTIQRECQAQSWKSHVRMEDSKQPHCKMSQTSNLLSLTSDTGTNICLLGEHGDCPLWYSPKNIQNPLAPQCPKCTFH